MVSRIRLCISAALPDVQNEQRADDAYRNACFSARIGSQQERFSSIGNVSELEGENTVCPSCGKLLVRRNGYNLLEDHLPMENALIAERLSPGGGRI